MSNNSPKYEEAELVFSLTAKEKAAIEYLYDNFSKALYTLIVSIVKEKEISNDVLQETFISIWKSIDSYDQEKGRLFTWMLRIARNASLDKIRSKEYTKSKKTDSFIDGHTIEPAIEYTNQEFQLKKTILKLNDEHRKLIDLSYFHGFTHEQLSKALDMPLGTVKSRLYSALKQLKTLLS